MLRFFSFLIGFGLTIIGGVYIIIYLNITTIGYNFEYYVNFIIKRFECFMFLIGILIMFISLYKEEKNEFYLRYSNKSPR